MRFLSSLVFFALCSSAWASSSSLSALKSQVISQSAKSSSSSSSLSSLSSSVLAQEDASGINANSVMVEAQAEAEADSARRYWWLKGTTAPDPYEICARHSKDVVACARENAVVCGWVDSPTELALWQAYDPDKRPLYARGTAYRRPIKERCTVKSNLANVHAQAEARKREVATIEAEVAECAAFDTSATQCAADKTCTFIEPSIFAAYNRHISSKFQLLHPCERSAEARAFSVISFGKYWLERERGEACAQFNNDEAKCCELNQQSPELADATCVFLDEDTYTDFKAYYYTHTADRCQLASTVDTITQNVEQWKQRVAEAEAKKQSKEVSE